MLQRNPIRNSNHVDRVRRVADGLSGLSSAELIRSFAELRRRGSHPQRSWTQKICRQTVRRRIGWGGLEFDAMGHVTEALRRVENLRYHDVQIVAGGVMAQGGIAEIATGEGKTLIAALPVACQIVRGRNVHVWTTNDYLARRDCERLTPIFRTLGLSVSLLQRGQLNRRRDDYQADVVYGPGYEFGFDFLRDQSRAWQQRSPKLGDRYLAKLSGRPEDRPTITLERRAVVVDEADSVLIDEAGVPLVMGEHRTDAIDDAERMRDVASEVSQFEADVHFRVGDGRRIAWLRPGVERIESFARTHRLGQGVRSTPSRPVELMFKNAVMAMKVFRRDVDYVIRDEKVAIVDPHTGRIDPDRRWQDGLHAAVEIAEGVAIQTPVVSVTRITRQKFVRRYEHVCGMTGTAMSSRRDFTHFYGCRVAVIPTNQPVRRTMHATKYFPNFDAKCAFIIADVRARSRAGGAVLIGCVSIQTAIAIDARLRGDGIDSVRLDGTQDAAEADIVAAAGRPGHVTVATNLAGRGTDIDAESADGGLHVIVTERQASRRIDRQLIGRSARQGQVGSAQVLTAGDDAWLSAADPRLAEIIKKSANSNGDTRDGWDRRIERLQRIHDRRAFESRRRLVAADYHTEQIQKSLASVA